MREAHPYSRRNHAGSHTQVRRAGVEAAAGVATGDLEDLLAATFTQYRKRAVAYCTAILGDPSRAEDAVQSATIDLLRRVRGGDADFFRSDPWRTLKRSLRWASAKQRRGLDLTGFDEVAPHEMGSAVIDPSGIAESRMVAASILERLPEHMREVLSLRLLADHADAASAARLGVTLDAFRGRYKRALIAARSAARALGVERVALVTVVAWRRRVLKLRDASAIVLRRVAGDGAACAAVLSGPPSSAAALAVAAMTLLGASAGSVPDRGSQAAPTHMLSSAPALQAAAVNGNTNGRSSARAPVSVWPQGNHVVPQPRPPTAEQETPDDTRFASVAASPNHPDTMVAYGQGRSCSCPVLFESHDGGAAWRAWAAPGLPVEAADAEVVLPSDYPDDSRRFLTGVIGNTATLMAIRLGGAFTPVLAPPGRLTLSSSFGRGTMHAYVWAGNLLWLVDLGAGTLKPVTFGAPVSSIDAVSAVPGGAVDELLVVADIPYAQVDAPEVGVAGRTRVFDCDGIDPCSVLSAPSIAGVGEISLSPRFAVDHTLVAAGPDQIWTSADGGRSFARGPELAGRALSGITLADDGTGGPALLATASGNAVEPFPLLLGSLQTSRWRDVSPPAGAVSGIDAAGHIVVIPPSLGLLCSTDGGAHWATRCPVR